MKTALLDTNVLIALEDASKPMPVKCADMLQRSRGKIRFYYHPKQIEDLDCDKNEERREIVKSRIAQFDCLEKVPDSDIASYINNGWSCNSRNDIVDNALLQCILDPVVNFLITEDRGMHKKARRAGLSHQIFTIDDFVDYLDANTAPAPEDLAVIENCLCRELPTEDSIFESLREDYEDFDMWFRDKCCREQRKCWVIKDQFRIRAICIYHIEKRPDYVGRVPAIKGRALKLCTFKVSENDRGAKTGERLLFAAFSFAKSNNIGFVYFTTNERKQSHLISLAKDFGFERLGAYQGDSVFGKKTLPCDNDQFDKYKFLCTLYPSFRDDSSVNKFIVPIKPQWHDRLFPDVSDFRNTLLGDDPAFYGPESNTIRKAYICKATIKRIEPGDLLLFYRSGDRRSIQVLGGVISAKRMYDTASIYEEVKNRTVYRPKEIQGMLDTANDGLLVIRFDLLVFLDTPVTLDLLHEHGVNTPQSICSFPQSAYNELFSKGR